MHEWILTLLALQMGFAPPSIADADSTVQIDPAVAVAAPAGPQQAVSIPPTLRYLSAAVMSASTDTVPMRDEWFAEDKLRHYFLSFAVTGLAYGAVRTTGLDGAPALALAGAGAAAAGLWKEFYDRSIGRPFSRRDLVWDGLGIVTGLILASQTR